MWAKIGDIGEWLFGDGTCSRQFLSAALINACLCVMLLFVIGYFGVDYLGAIIDHTLVGMLCYAVAFSAFNVITHMCFFVCLGLLDWLKSGDKVSDEDGPVQSD